LKLYRRNRDRYNKELRGKEMDMKLGYDVRRG
jgi:hypothetical protein